MYDILVALVCASPTEDTPENTLTKEGLSSYSTRSMGHFLLEELMAI